MDHRNGIDLALVSFIYQNIELIKSKSTQSQ